jgi:hypothetical protein
VALVVVEFLNFILILLNKVKTRKDLRKWKKKRHLRQREERKYKDREEKDTD